MQETEKPNLLLVDDRPENLLVLENILEDLDCHLFKATSGYEALRQVMNHDFALVILDVQMPDIDGFEVAKLMRGTSHSKHIPIIFVTAISKEQEHIFKGYETGAVDYLFKPINPDILRSKAKVFIELHKQKKLLERQAKELTIAKEAAEAANKAKSAFLASISHELRTPLNVILGMAQIMNQSPDIPQEHREYLESLLRNGHHLLLLVNRLIEASKLKAKRPFSGEHEFDVAHLLDEVHAITRQQAEGVLESNQDGAQDSLTPSALADLPEELRVSLQAAAEGADFEMTLDIIDRIRQHNQPLAATLAKLAKNYRFDILQELFEKKE